MQRSGGQWEHDFTLKDLGNPCKCILGKNFGQQTPVSYLFHLLFLGDPAAYLILYRKSSASSFRSFPVLQKTMLLVPVSSPTDKRDLVEENGAKTTPLPPPPKKNPTTLEEWEPNPEREVRWDRSTSFPYSCCPHSLAQQSCRRLIESHSFSLHI